uniref:DUF4974 domain-containing protein n=3 Tax=unclassified Prevotella TaxID=2638335 RepID=A0AB33IW04_9BACT
MDKKLETDFVLHHYQEGKLDTQEALRKFRAYAGIKPKHTALRIISIAASFLILLSVGTYMLFRQPTTTLTAGAETKTFLLADSTRVTLSPHSTISYRGDDCRQIAMTGKIYFEVKHDEQHPFDVESSKGHVRVLGTKFEIDETSALTEVYVNSGKVLFTGKDETDGIMLTRGMRAVISKEGDRPTRITDEDENHVSWATHRFHFDNTPINEVVEDLNAHYGTHLTAPNTNKRLTGNFDAGKLDEIIEIINKTLDINL